MSSSADRIIARAAREIETGMTVNLGIGLPQKVPDYLHPDLDICLQSENGISGVGPSRSLEDADRNLIDAGGTYISTIPGAAFFDSAVSFAMIRSGRVHLSILGALQVGANGDLANWVIPGRFTPGVGGGMELAQKARRVVIMSFHTDRAGRSKIVERCSLPITAPGCVDRVITDLAVLDVTPQGLLLRELADGVTSDEVAAATDAPIGIAEQDLPTF